MTNVTCILGNSEYLKDITKISIEGVKSDTQFGTHHGTPCVYRYTIDYKVYTTAYDGYSIVYHYSITESISRPPEEVITERMMEAMSDLAEITLINICNFDIYDATTDTPLTNKKITLINCFAVTHERRR